MEVSLRKFENAVNAVVRLHNFCRDRAVEVPMDNIGSAVMPGEIIIDDDGLIACDYFDTAPLRSGRPAKNQAFVSKPREMIRKHLEVFGIVRPEHNLVRNRNRAS